MKMQIKKFGKLLISRPAGKEAFAFAKAYLLPEKMNEITLDFEGVEVLSPSWWDEFISGVRSKYKKVKIKLINTSNESVKATLEVLSRLSTEQELSRQ